MPDFIADYVLYHSAYEIPRNYVYYCALGLISSIKHKQLYFLHGDIEIHSNLYILLVGPQGNAKTTPLDFAKKMLQDVAPDLKIGASTQTAEDIVTVMCRDDFVRSYKNELDEPIEVRPYTFFINEFKNFIAYAPTRMLNFLGDIYDRKFFDSSTIKRGAEMIVNPCLTIIACENPEQLMGFMKTAIFTGGLSRRFIMVYETDYADPKPFIEILDNSAERLAWQRVKQRLIDCRKVVGRFQWAESGKKFYAPWYVKTKMELRQINNSILKGYVGTKHVQLFKICMLLDCVSDKPMLLFTDELLELGLSFLNIIEKNMPKLSMASGRSEVMEGQLKLLEALRANVFEGVPGWIPEKQLKKLAEGDFKNPSELFSVLRHLEDSGQIIKRGVKIKNSEGTVVERVMYIDFDRHEMLVKSGAIEEVRKY